MRLKYMFLSGILTVLLMMVVFFSGISCPTASLKLSFRNLANLGLGNGHYEGWVLVEDEPVSTGKFVLDDEGNVTSPDGSASFGTEEAAFFPVLNRVLQASKIMISVEPEGDVDRIPSLHILLAGKVVEGVAELYVDVDLADFELASGLYVLATPSDDLSNPRANNDQGIWWMIPGVQSEPGLILPILPEGWMYEGWVTDRSVETPVPISTGRFLAPSGPDQNGPGPYRGPDPGAPYPGEDFLNGLVLDLNTGNFQTAITVEPEPDNSDSPFQLAPLSHDIPLDARTAPFNHAMINRSADFPVGTAEIALSRP